VTSLTSLASLVTNDTGAKLSTDEILHDETSHQGKRLGQFRAFGQLGRASGSVIFIFLYIRFFVCCLGLF
jgi:hypothetical protein